MEEETVKIIDTAIAAISGACALFSIYGLLRVLMAGGSPLNFVANVVMFSIYPAWFLFRRKRALGRNRNDSRL